MQCEKEISPNDNDPVDFSVELDIQGMEKGAENAEAAFLSGDPDQVIELCSENKYLQ